MLILLLATSLAFAQDPPGIEVVQPGETFVPTVKIFALPEPYYDSCLEKAKLLDATKKELTTQQGLTQEAMDQSEKAIDGLQSEIKHCGSQVGQLNLQMSALQERNKGLKAQRNILVGTVAAVVLVAGTGTWAALRK